MPCPGTPIFCRVQTPGVVFVSGSPTDVDGLGVTFSARIRPGACCLAPALGYTCFQRGRTLEPPVSGHLDTPGPVTNALTDIATRLLDENFRDSPCDGAYPHRERRGIAPAQPIKLRRESCHGLGSESGTDGFWSPVVCHLETTSVTVRVLTGGKS